MFHSVGTDHHGAEANEKCSGRRAEGWMDGVKSEWCACKAEQPRRVVKVQRLARRPEDTRRVEEIER